MESISDNIKRKIIQLIGKIFNYKVMSYASQTNSKSFIITPLKSQPAVHMLEKEYEKGVKAGKEQILRKIRSTILEGFSDIQQDRLHQHIGKIYRDNGLYY